MTDTESLASQSFCEITRKCKRFTARLDDWNVDDLKKTIKDLQNLMRSLRDSRGIRAGFIRHLKYLSAEDEAEHLSKGLPAFFAAVIQRIHAVIGQDVTRKLNNQPHDLIMLCSSLMHVLRNAVVECEEAQERFLQFAHALLCDTLDRNNHSGATFFCQPALWIVAEQHNVAIFLRLTAQFIANCVFDNELAANTIWKCVGKRTDFQQPTQGLASLMQSSDVKTAIAAQMIVLHCIDMHRTERCKDLVGTPGGARILRTLMYNAERYVHRLVDSSQDEPPSKADAGLYTIPEQIFDLIMAQGLFDEAMKVLQGCDRPGCDIQKEHPGAMCQCQAGMLHFLASYLNEIVKAGSDSILLGAQSLKELPNIFHVLAPLVTSLMNQRTPLNASTSTTKALLAHQDGIISSLLRCFTCVTVITEKDALFEDPGSRAACDDVVEQLRTEAFLDKLLDLYRASDRFAPIISPFKSGVKGDSMAAAAAAALPEGHVLSSTGKAAASNGHGSTSPTLNNLKRDIIALIASIAFKRDGRGAQEHKDVRAVQDFMVKSDGLLLILESTQLDEQNPYIREHAIFCLRNLLKDNVEAQAFIDQIRPVTSNGSGGGR